MLNSDAKPIIEKYHYSKTWPGSAQFSWGVRRGTELVGCVVFGPGSNRHTAGYLQVADGEYLELLRLWLKDNCPPNSESFVIGAAIRLIRKHLPQIRCLISYADPDVGHNGAIYQATNWIYVGESSPISKVRIGNEMFHFRSIHDKYGTKDMNILREMFDDVETVRVAGKHVYVYPLDEKRIRPYWERRRKPYPKRNAQ